MYYNNFKILLLNFYDSNLEVNIKFLIINEIKNYYFFIFKKYNKK